MTYYLGIDIGGTEIKGGIVNESGKILEVYKFPTALEKEKILHSLKELVKTALSKDIRAIGISTAGSVNMEKGSITEISGNINDWAFTPLKNILEQEYNTPVFVGNDGNLALLAEMNLGAGRNGEHVIMLTLGTGLGSGFYFKDLGLFYGSHWKGAELGHTILHPKGRPCFCGKRGCADKYVSGTGLELNYFEKTKIRKSGIEIMDSISQDSYALLALEDFLQDLSQVLINIKNIFDPDIIILGGGVIASKDIWWENMIMKYKDMGGSLKDMEIKPSKFLNTSGIIGAAMLAKESVENYENM
ncbi:MAG: ROK family protein [Tissierellia bacterium]|nr:ROK family protein [Tissierellia bacterium]